MIIILLWYPVSLFHSSKTLSFPCCIAFKHWLKTQFDYIWLHLYSLFSSVHPSLYPLINTMQLPWLRHLHKPWSWCNVANIILFSLAILNYLHKLINCFLSSWVGFEGFSIQSMYPSTLLNLVENHPKYSTTFYVLKSNSRGHTHVDTLKVKEDRVETSSHNPGLAETSEKYLLGAQEQ